MRRRGVLAASVAWAGGSAGPWAAGARTATGEAAQAGDWPLTGDLAAHDPALYVDDSGQWIFGTGPGLPRLHSSDGLHWTRREPVFDAASRPAWWARQVPAHDGVDVWAPKAWAHRGRVWLMYAVSTFGSQVSAIGLASADAPGAVRWRDGGLVLASSAGDDFNAIDPDVWTDPVDGRLWMAWGSWWGGLRVAELDPDELRPKGPVHAVARRRGGIEAPTLQRRGDWIYLFMSWGLCCKGVDSTYEIRVGRSAAPTGPYVDREGHPLLEGGGTLLRAGQGRWKGPGHQDVHGDDIVFHAYDTEGSGQPRLRRATLRWSDDGWPLP